MIYVKPMPGKRIIDPERRDWLPVDRWRPVPPGSYWAGLARGGDILLRREAPPQDEIEGYDPAPVPAGPAKRTRRSAA